VLLCCVVRTGCRSFTRIASAGGARLARYPKWRRRDCLFLAARRTCACLFPATTSSPTPDPRLTHISVLLVTYAAMENYQKLEKVGEGERDSSHPQPSQD